MPKISFSLDTDLLVDVEEYAEENHDDVRSEAIRCLLEKGLEYDDVVDDLEGELEHERARADDLRRQLQAVQERQENVDELAEYVEEERSLERRRREAGLVTRAKWWLTGMDVDDDRDE